MVKRKRLREENKKKRAKEQEGSCVHRIRLSLSTRNGIRDTMRRERGREREAQRQSIWLSECHSALSCVAFLFHQSRGWVEEEEEREKKRKRKDAIPVDWWSLVKMSERREREEKKIKENARIRREVQQEVNSQIQLCQAMCPVNESRRR